MQENLTRARFGFGLEIADLVAEEIAVFCEVVPLEWATERWSSDPDHDPVVEAALLARADAVVTGDAALLRLRIPGVRFLTPAEVLALLRWLCGTPRLVLHPVDTVEV